MREQRSRIGRLVVDPNRVRYIWYDVIDDYDDRKVVTARITIAMVLVPYLGAECAKTRHCEGVATHLNA